MSQKAAVVRSPPSRPAFSVIMPVHEKERHVEAAIRSVLSQSFDSFELIVIDDASTDGSREVIASIESPRIRVLEREVPGPGGYAARNLGISVARGAWLTFLDADDTWSSDRLERLWDAIQACPDATLHACGWYVATREGGRRPNKYARRHGARGAHVLSLEDYLRTFRRNEQPIHTDTMAIRHDALPDHTVFPADLEGRRGGDVYAWLRLLVREKRIAWSPHIGASYFVDADNMVTRTEASTADFLRRANVLELEHGLTSKQRTLLRQAVNQHIWRAWFGNVSSGGAGFDLRRRLFWDDAGVRPWLLALSSLTPGVVVRLLMRVARRSPFRG